MDSRWFFFFFPPPSPRRLRCNPCFVFPSLVPSEYWMENKSEQFDGKERCPRYPDYSTMRLPIGFGSLSCARMQRSFFSHVLPVCLFSVYFALSFVSDFHRERLSNKGSRGKTPQETTMHTGPFSLWMAQLVGAMTFSFGSRKKTWEVNLHDPDANNSSGTKHNTNKNAKNKQEREKRGKTKFFLF